MLLFCHTGIGQHCLPERCEYGGVQVFHNFNLVYGFWDDWRYGKLGRGLRLGRYSSRKGGVLQGLPQKKAALRFCASPVLDACGSVTAVRVLKRRRPLALTLLLWKLS